MTLNVFSLTHSIDRNDALRHLKTAELALKSQSRLTWHNLFFLSFHNRAAFCAYLFFSSKL